MCVEAGQAAFGTLAWAATCVALHRRPDGGRGARGTGLEHHLITNAFEPPREPLGGAFGMLAVEVVTAVFAILAAIASGVDGAGGRGVAPDGGRVADFS